MNDSANVEEQLGELAALLKQGTNLAPQVMREVRRIAAEPAAAVPRRRIPRRVVVCAGALAVAAIILALVWFPVRDRQAAAWANVVEAVAKKPWLHYVRTYDDGTRTEFWFSATGGVAAGKATGVGTKSGPVLTWIDYTQNTRDSYDPKQNTIVRTTENAAWESSPFEIIFKAFLSADLSQSIDAGRVKLVHESQHVVTEGSKRWIEHRFRARDENSTGEGTEWVVCVDPETRLPFRWYIVWHHPSDPSISQAMPPTDIDYPSTGPADIYAMGVPKTAKIVDRTLRSDVERLVARLIAPSRWANTRFSAIVVSSSGSEPWWRGHVQRVRKDGLRWKVEQFVGSVFSTPWAPRPAEDAEAEKWWKQKAGILPFTPLDLCDGKWYWSYRRLADRPPTQAEIEAGIPKNSKIIVSTEKKRSRPVFKDSFWLGYPLCYMGRFTSAGPEPPFGLAIWPEAQAVVNLKPKSGPPNTVLLEVHYPEGEPSQFNDWGHSRIFRFWIDPQRDDLVVRAEGLVTRRGKEEINGGLVIEGLTQDPQGRWYPSVVRLLKIGVSSVGDNRPVVGNGIDTILRFYYDFETPIPESVFTE